MDERIKDILEKRKRILEDISKQNLDNNFRNLVVERINTEIVDGIVAIYLTDPVGFSVDIATFLRDLDDALKDKKFGEDLRSEILKEYVGGYQIE